MGVDTLEKITFVTIEKTCCKNVDLFVSKIDACGDSVHTGWCVYLPSPSNSLGNGL